MEHRFGASFFHCKVKMNNVYIACLCLFAAVTIRADQQNADAVVVNLYNKLDFLDTFLSQDELYLLQYSAEDISLETFSALYSAQTSYEQMRSEMLSWCVLLNYTSDDTVQGSTILESRDEFVTKVYIRFNVMKTYFDLITKYASKTNTKTENSRPDWKSSQDGANVTGNITTSKTPTEVTGDTRTFEDKLNYAKRLIEKALRVFNVIKADRNKKFNLKETVDNCKPLLDRFGNPRALRLPYKPPPIIILPSKGETLRVHSRNCSNDGSVCEAILSKSNLKRLLKVFTFEKTIADFFNAFDSFGSTEECKNAMQLFIGQSFLFWAPKLPQMGSTQFLKISICLKADSNAHTLSIVN